MLTKTKTIQETDHSPAEAYLAASADVRKVVLSHGSMTVLRRAALERAWTNGDVATAGELRSLAQEIEGRS